MAFPGCPALPDCKELRFIFGLNVGVPEQQRGAGAELYLQLTSAPAWRRCAVQQFVALGEDID